MSRGWLTGLFGDGVKNFDYAQEGKRRYRCGLIRRDVAAYQRHHLQSWGDSVSRQNGRRWSRKNEQGGCGPIWQDPYTG